MAERNTLRRLGGYGEQVRGLVARFDAPGFDARKVQQRID